jgi:hypothetical protein
MELAQKKRKNLFPADGTGPEKKKKTCSQLMELVQKKRKNLFPADGSGPTVNT